MLLVAPADPARFGAIDALAQAAPAMPTCVVASANDPWMAAPRAQAWARLWGSDWINLGNAGHINIDSGHGPFPLARDSGRRRLEPAGDPGARRGGLSAAPVPASPAGHFPAGSISR